ncbi:MAG: acetylxylan esterase [Clostridia bacterium]|nr:acetylxylan esterase [Clostridia bacterium]
MKNLKSTLALVLLLAMVLCAVVPTYAETLSNAADVSTDFDYVAFEMEAVNSNGETTMFYDKGESVTLNIVLFGIKGGVKTQLTTPKVKITINSDDGTTTTQTVNMTNGTASYTFNAINIAGWQRIRLRALDASGNDLTGDIIKEYTGGIVVDRDNVTTSIEKPADFESWWAQVIEEELDTCPPEVISVEQIDNGTYLAYRMYVTAPTLRDSEHQFLESGDTYVSFNLSFPKAATAGSCFIRANFQGYNMGVGGYWGGSKDTILLNVNAHSTTLHETHTYDEISAWERGTSGKYGWDATRTADRDDHYFKYMILRDLQAIRFAQLCFGPEGYNKTVDGIDFSQFKGLWDGKNVRVMGTSQGGFQATAMAALCPEVTYCETSMTWLCDVAGGASDGKVKSSFRPARVKNTDGRYGLDYFDTAFFATMVECPYNLTVVGAGDITAPVSGILAMYNNLNVPEKSISFTQGRDHMTGKDIWQYHTYFGDASESYGSETGCSVSADGYAVRTEDYTGLRSIFSFNSKYNSYYGQKGLTLSEYGALMMSSDNFESMCGGDEKTMYDLGVAGTSSKVKYIPVYKMVNGEQKGRNKYLSVENGIYTYCVTLTGIPEANYKDDVYVCAYAKWTDTNGNETLEFTHYTDTLGQDARSLYDVTAAAYKLGVVNSTLAPDFDTIIWPVLEKGAVTLDGFKYLDVPYYDYTWYTDEELTTLATNINGGLNYFPGDETPTESGIVWSLIEYGNEYVATYRLADGADPAALPRLTYIGAGDGFAVFQPFDSRFNGAKGGKNFAELDTLTPTLSDADSALVKTLVIDSGITGANNYGLAYMSSVENVVLSSDFDLLSSGTFHDDMALTKVFEAGTEAQDNTIDLSSVATVASGSWLFTNCRAAKNIIFPANATIRNAYGIFRDCFALERVWIDGDDLPEVGTINLGSAAQLHFDVDAFKNAYLINTVILADATSFTTNEWLTRSLNNTGKDNPYSDTITVNLICRAGSAAETAIKAQPITAAVMSLKVALNGNVLTNAGDIEIDIGELG